MDFPVIDRMGMASGLGTSDARHRFDDLGVFPNPLLERFYRFRGLFEGDRRRHGDANEDGPFFKRGDELGAQLRNENERGREDRERHAQNHARMPDRRVQKRGVQALEQTHQGQFLCRAGNQQQ